MEIKFLISCVGILLATSAMFSMSEVVIIRISAETIHRLSKLRKGNKSIKMLHKIADNKETYLATILLANNISNTAISSFGAMISASLLIQYKLSNISLILINTAVMTALIFLLGEALPKSIAMTISDKLSLILARPIVYCVRIFKPFTILFTTISNIIVKKFAHHSNDQTSFAQEIKNTIEVRHKQGKVVEDDIAMFNGLLDLNKTEVSDIMRNRNEIFLLDINLPTAEIMDKTLEASYSRIPVYEKTQDNIIGILHVKDLFIIYKKLKDKLSTKDIREILIKPMFVPENATLYKQLIKFKSNRSHMAIIVDEFGVVGGIVTLEDILEEIVGEINDEHDEHENEGIIQNSDGTIIVDGDYHIHDFSRKFNIDMGDVDVTTVAGLIIDKLERIPSKGERLSLLGYSILIKETEENKITKVIMKKEQTEHRED